MDLRYGNVQGASPGPENRREALVRSYLGKARRANVSAQAYGGSTGGPGSYQGYSGGAMASSARGAQLQDSRELMRQYGSGVLGGSQLGGRAAIAEIKGYRQAAGTGVELDQP